MGGSEKERVLGSKESVYQSRVIADCRENLINRKTAAGLLNLSERQISRLSKHFEPNTVTLISFGCFLD